MWLSVEQKRHIRQYAYVNGFKNVAWITGYVDRVRENCLFLNPGLSDHSGPPVPVFIDPARRRDLPGPGQALALTCRISAPDGLTPPIATLNAMAVDRPSPLNLSPREVFRMALGVSEDDTDVTGGMGNNQRSVASRNVVHLAGLVDRLEGLPGQGGLQLFLRQSPGERSLLPVRLGPKLRDRFRSILHDGMPVFIEGAAKARANSQRQEWQPYIQVRDLRVPQPGRDILAMPDWGYRFMATRVKDPEILRLVERMRGRQQTNQATVSLSLLDDL